MGSLDLGLLWKSFLAFMRCKRILIRIGTVCQLLAGMAYWDLQLNVGLIALVPTSASPALQHKFNNPSVSSLLPIPSSKFAQCKLLHSEPTPGPPPSLFPLFSYFFFFFRNHPRSLLNQWMRECLKPGKDGNIFSLVRSGWGGKRRGLQGGSLKTGNHVAACMQGPADVNELLRGERLAA